MYITIPEARLIHRQHYRPRPDDIPIYEREYNGHRVLTHKAEPSRHMGPATPYGTAYVDARDELWIVPDEWSDDDALLAYEARWPDPPIPETDDPVLR